MRNQESVFRHPKKQIVVVVMAVAIFYAFLVFLLGWPSFEDILITMVVLVFLRTDLIPANVAAIIGDLILFVVVFFASLAFFAQFVLPLHSIQERRDVIVRLISYTFGRHGPAVTIQNGVEIKRKREGVRSGPGVILLDSASAAVMRTAVAVTRSVGPGTVFTRRFERIAGTVDLHPQTQFIGPSGDEDPFDEQAQEDEDEDDLRDRQKRRWETSGLTRDGVEVVPNIIVGFRLISEPGQGHTQFGFNPDSVWKAIVHEGIGHGEKGEKDESYRVHWTHLPAYLAADLWREHLRKFTFEELFAFTGARPKDSDPRTGYEIIVAAMNDRMKNLRVEKLDEYGRATDRIVPSREYRILRERGLQVNFATAANLRFPKPIDDDLSKQWRATWLERAQEEQRNIRSRRMNAQHEGHQTALFDFAGMASRPLSKELIDFKNAPQHHPKLSPTLEFLVRGTLEQCVRDPELNRHLTNEKNDLADLIEWIRKN